MNVVVRDPLKGVLVLPNTGHSEMEPEISLLWLTTLEAEVIQYFKESSPRTRLPVFFAYFVFMFRLFVILSQIKWKQGARVSAL